MKAEILRLTLSSGYGDEVFGLSLVCFDYSLSLVLNGEAGFYPLSFPPPSSFLETQTGTKAAPSSFTPTAQSNTPSFMTATREGVREFVSRLPWHLPPCASLSPCESRYQQDSPSLPALTSPSEPIPNPSSLKTSLPSTQLR